MRISIKKAQITLFIILGIVIIFAFSLLYYTEINLNTDAEIAQQQNFDNTVDAFSSYVETCLSGLCKNAIGLYCNSGSCSHLALEQYLKLKAADCFDESLILNADIQVELPMLININESESAVDVLISLPTLVSQGGLSRTVDSYSFSISKTILAKDYLDNPVNIDGDELYFDHLPEPVRQSLYQEGELIVAYSRLPEELDHYAEFLESVNIIRREPLIASPLIDLDAFDEDMRDTVELLLKDEVIFFNESDISFEDLRDSLFAFDFVSSVSRNINHYTEQFIPIYAMKRRFRGRDIHRSSDNFYQYQWYLNNLGQFAGTPGADINITDAWAITKGSNDVIISIIDEGIFFDNPDLSSRLLVDKSYDFVDEDNDANPTAFYETHGTHVAGIAAAESENNLGIIGICPSCNIISMRILDPLYGADSQTLINAVILSVANGAGIVSMSLGSSHYSQYEDSVFTRLADKGIIFVAAAGNDGLNQKNYPAAYQGVISVGSTDNNDERSSFSNYGNWVDIYAPGDLILSACTNNQFCFKSGTSMATPVISGIIGLMRSQKPGLAGAEALKIIQENAVTIAGGIKRVDAGSALASMN